VSTTDLHLTTYEGVYCKSPRGRSTKSYFAFHINANRELVAANSDSAAVIAERARPGAPTPAGAARHPRDATNA
jgi:hypothetical protein